jgi:CcmD family protein
MEQRNFTFLVYGLACAWLILFVYVILLVQRTRKLRDQLARAERQREIE